MCVPSLLIFQVALWSFSSKQGRYRSRIYLILPVQNSVMYVACGAELSPMVCKKGWIQLTLSRQSTLLALCNLQAKNTRL